LADVRDLRGQVQLCAPVSVSDRRPANRSGGALSGGSGSSRSGRATSTTPISRARRSRSSTCSRRTSRPVTGSSAWSWTRERRTSRRERSGGSCTERRAACSRSSRRSSNSGSGWSARLSPSRTATPPAHRPVKRAYGSSRSRARAADTRSRTPSSVSRPSTGSVAPPATRTGSASTSTASTGRAPTSSRERDGRGGAEGTRVAPPAPVALEQALLDRRPPPAARDARRLGEGDLHVGEDRALRA
jgi:hypothetical protein